MLADGYLSKLFEDPAELIRSTNLTGAASPENLFSILETLEDSATCCWDIIQPFTPYDDAQRESEEDYTWTTRPLSSNPTTSSTVRPHETDEDEDEASLARKKLKFVAAAADDGQGKMSHITVERNRRKQVNDHLLLLRSLMPCFYVNRGDQASIIGGVVDYIKELQQVLQSMEAKKQRNVYSDQVLISPRPPVPPISPRPSPILISPTTPQSAGSPYKPRPVPYLSPANIAPSSSHDSFLSLDSCAELAAAANSKSPVADVEVKFSGPNVLLNTVSRRIPGQTTKIITALEGHSLEILQMNINSLDDTTLNSFTIKIGIECELSAEELAQEILQTFS